MTTARITNPAAATIAVTIAAAIVLAACAGTAMPPPSANPPSAPPSATASGTTSGRPVASMGVLPTPAGSQVPVTGEAPADILDRIVADARERLGAEGIVVVRDEAVTWADGSLGCPQPGMMYTQALVDGYHVVVTDGTTQLDYRVGTGGSFFVCEGRLPRG